jgi:hypothetical protein
MEHDQNIYLFIYFTKGDSTIANLIQNLIGNFQIFDN